MLCHCCETEIIGCSGSVSWPTGRPFQDPPIFHCPHCTEFNLARGRPCLGELKDGVVRRHVRGQDRPTCSWTNRAGPCGPPVVMFYSARMGKRSKGGWYAYCQLCAERHPQIRHQLTTVLH